MQRAIFFISLTALCVPQANADENLWVYARAADTLPKGELELKFRDIAKLDKDSGDYALHDLRTELEYGVTDRLTASIELAGFHHNYSVDDENLQPLFDSQGGEGGRFKDTQYAGFELGLKYNILSNYKDLFGLAVKGAYERRNRYRLDGAPINQDSFAFTAMLQKNFLEDRLSFAITPKLEFERRKSPGVLEEEISFDVSAGVSYRFAQNWFAGLEFRHQSDYLSPQIDGEFEPTQRRSSFDLTDFRVGSQFQRGNYFGPVIHYGGKAWWGTLGTLFQVRGGGHPLSYSRNNRNWDEHERLHVGLAFGLQL
jgi:opacity protein-like surface antigen